MHICAQYMTVSVKQCLPYIFISQLITSDWEKLSPWNFIRTVHQQRLIDGRVVSLSYGLESW